MLPLVWLMCVYGNVRQDNVRLFTWFFLAGSLSGWPTVFGCQMEGLFSPSTRCFTEKVWLWNSCRQQLLGYTIVRSPLWLHIHTQSAKFFMRAVSLVVIYSYQTPPTYLTPPLPVVGKTSSGQEVEDSGNYLEDGQKREKFKSNLNTFISRGDQSPVFVLY